MTRPLLKVTMGGVEGRNTNRPIKPSKEGRRKATRDFLMLLAS